MAAVPGYGSSASKVGHSGGGRVWEGIEEEESKTPAQRHLSRGVPECLVTRLSVVGFRYLFRSEEG
ncbi:hypothetical protein N7530_008008 [Penicillium desertorum]|uniref:Uncharacterized protein n=1 Tax=Penicillium desertorum TaxID=1303715 RepID=A0A9W9WNG3_9EURO|nr:hypothetical protein N7530_008008 [Penicillium desertorum]